MTRPVYQTTNAWDVARVGHIDLCSEAGFASALRPGTPRQVLGYSVSVRCRGVLRRRLRFGLSHSRGARTDAEDPSPQPGP
jgi:hypothetical protein